MDARATVARILLPPTILRRQFVFAFLFAWVGVVIVAAGVLYAIVGEFAPPDWVTAVLSFFWWPFFLGWNVAWFQVVWLTLLAWGIARIAVRTWYGPMDPTPEGDR